MSFAGVKSRSNLYVIIKEWAEMIKIEHTVFALPFALSGFILGTPKSSIMATQLSMILWAVLAFTAARSAAMTLNRVIDNKIDGLNPRTKERAIPQGRIGQKEAIVFVVIAFAVMLFAASKLPPLCLWLSPIAILWLGFYSYTKRFTWLCHIALGIALAGAALGGWAAAAGNILGLAPWILSLAVMMWVAGFDIIYACQDIQFDRIVGLCSIPAAFGVANALTVAKCFHIVTVVALILLGICMKLGAVFFGGVFIVAIMLAWEHSLVKPNDLSKVNAAFFNVNGIVSIITFMVIFLDRSLTY